MAPRKSIATTVWHFFENQTEIGKAVCNLCKLQLKNDRNFNLKTHLLKVHNIDLRNIDSSTTSSIYDITPSISARKQNIKVQISKKILFRSYIGLVIEDSVPFKVLNSPNLRNIIDPICEGLGVKLDKRFSLNAENCKTTLNQVALSIRNNMKMEMSKRLLSLKIDSAPRLSRNIFGFSAQFIKEDEIKSLILGMVELKDIDANNSNNLTAEILKTLNKYDIQLNQIISITSDNGANMIKTNKILSSEDNEVVDEDLNNTYLNNIKNLEKPSNLCVEHIPICRCAAHTAQLCALDVTKDAEIKGFLLCCRNFTKFIRKTSNGFKDAFEMRNLKPPPLDCSTRWGSTYKMIQSLLAAKDVLIDVETIGNKTTDEIFVNNDTLWEFMECYVAVFTPLQDAIVKFQAEHLHYGNFYAHWLKCKMLTSKIVQKNGTNNWIQKIGDKVLKSMEKRTAELLDNEKLIACLFLDPRFHHTLSSEQRQKAVLYLNHLWGIFRSISSALEFDGDTAFMAPQDTFEDETEEMLNSYLTEKLPAPYGEIIHTDVYSKIGNLHLPFMRSDTNVLQFWKERKYSEPVLYALSNVCFGIPSTQVTIDRPFSSLKPILTNNRNRMNNDTLEDILLVKLNATFLNDAIHNLSLFEDPISVDLED